MPMSLNERLVLINQFRKNAPVDVMGLSRVLGVPVREVPLPPGVSGMIERVRGEDDYAISVNTSDPPTRKRFTVAHELGHFMLHRYLLGEGMDEDRAYRSIAGGKYKNTRIGAREETEANKFAANLLMPWELIERLKAEAVTTPEALANRLGVSVHAMSIRLGVPYNPLGV